MPGDREPIQEERTGADEGAARRGWSSADIVQCVGCYYWYRMGDYGNVCNYPLVKNRLRPCLPGDCYKHRNTPYISDADALAAYQRERDQQAEHQTDPGGTVQASMTK